MMYKKLTALVCCILMTSVIFTTESNFITYDWLIDCAQKTAYTDHIPHFRRLFNTIKVRGLLECGCGYSTKYFLDHCDKVVSIEFMTPGTDALWFNECLRLYQNCVNWTPLAYNEDHKDESFNQACGYQCSFHRDYALIDASYLEGLDQYFKNQIHIAHREEKDIDVAFVDAGVYTRGDMVKVLLANQVPIVMAHDTASDVGSQVDEGLYGWFKIKTPFNYEKIYIPFGQGTTFWISKSLPNVIESIQIYRDKILEQNGRVLSFEELTQIADRF